MGFWMSFLVCGLFGVLIFFSLAFYFSPCAHTFCLSMTFFGMVSLEWFWKEKQLFTSHWTLLHFPSDCGARSHRTRQSPSPSRQRFGTHIPANVLQTWPRGSVGAEAQRN